jgi:hypothetical protein
VTPLEDVVLIVSDDRAVVEADLAAGRLVCPRCRAGVLGGWGCSRLREVRTGLGVRRLRPRRGRCRERSCRATHVLLPGLCLARRCYVAEVIGAALLSAGREGYRRAGERLGVPGETGSGDCWYRNRSNRLRGSSRNGALRSRPPLTPRVDSVRAPRTRDSDRVRVSGRETGAAPLRPAPFVRATSRGTPFVGVRERRSMMTNKDPIHDGELAAKISNTVVRALSRTTGRGPHEGKDHARP